MDRFIDSKVLLCFCETVLNYHNNHTCIITNTLFCYALGQILFPNVPALNGISRNYLHLSLYSHCSCSPVSSHVLTYAFSHLDLGLPWSDFFFSSIFTTFLVTISSFILKTAPYTPWHCTNNWKFHLQRPLCWPDTQLRVILSINIS